MKTRVGCVPLHKNSTAGQFVWRIVGNRPDHHGINSQNAGWPAGFTRTRSLDSTADDGLLNDFQRYDFKVRYCLEFGETSQRKATTVQRWFVVLVKKWRNGNPTRLWKKIVNLGLGTDFRQDEVASGSAEQ